MLKITKRKKNQYAIYKKILQTQGKERIWHSTDSQNIHLEKKFLQGIEEHFKFNALESAKSGINIAKNQTWRENMIKIILMVKNGQK